MDLQSVTNINIDFYDKKYILINAKQYDIKSRFLLVTCYDHGEISPINASDHSVYIRYKKPDNNSVFNYCQINSDGKILVELTEQMLSSEGISCVDLVLVKKGHAKLDTETGEIIAIDNSYIISTMVFYIDVSETAINNSDVESSYEYDGLNTLLERAEAEYSEVIRLAKSYSIGNAGGIRVNENIDNAKYYCEQSKNYSLNSKTSEDNSYTNYKMAESYAVGGTGVRENEDITNAKYYCQVVKNVVDGLNSGFIPMGTVSFSQLSTVEKATGFSYNISDDFVTDDRFKEGAGKSYTAGTNVYYTSDGYWDCFGGSASVTASVDEVKSYLGI